MITLGTGSSGDLLIQNGNLVILSDEAQIAQSVREALGFFLGEWFLDNTQGVPWLQEILIDSPNVDTIQAVLTNAILSVPGVATLENLDLNLDNAARTMNVTLSFKTTNGQTLDLETTVGI